jgi:hypothetical protein
MRLIRIKADDHALNLCRWWSQAVVLYASCLNSSQQTELQKDTSAYLIPPKQDIMLAVFESLPEMDELDDTMLTNVVSQRLDFVPRHRGALGEQSHGDGLPQKWRD